MNTTKPFIYLSPPHMSGFEQEYIKEAFEKEICEHTGAKGAVALSSGTAALHLALRLLGIGPGDRVTGCSVLP